MVEMQRAEEVPLDFPATEKKRHGLRALWRVQEGNASVMPEKRPAVAGGGKG